MMSNYYDTNVDAPDVSFYDESLKIDAWSTDKQVDVTGVSTVTNSWLLVANFTDLRLQ
jgi:hypothetical protein